MAKTRIGGSFAPPITDELLAEYCSLCEQCKDRKAQGYMRQLVVMLNKFNETPRSTIEGTPHPVGVGVIVPLEPDEIERIWDEVPWPEECDLMGKAFDVLKGDVRKAAYHLLWYARELTADREPITNDLL